MRLFLGDQSVVITKDFIFVLRRRTCGFAVFRVLVRAHCRGVASASLRACGVFVLAGASEGTSESKSSSVNSL